MRLNGGHTTSTLDLPYVKVNGSPPSRSARGSHVSDRVCPSRRLDVEQSPHDEPEHGQGHEYDEWQPPMVDQSFHDFLGAMCR
jgi:hypothetical protein